MLVTGAPDVHQPAYINMMHVDLLTPFKCLAFRDHYVDYIVT